MLTIRSGQASVELLVVVSVIMLILAVMGFFIYQKYVRGDEMKIFVHGTRIVNMIAENVNEISIVGSGYTQFFTLSQMLYGNREYTVSFFRNESTVYLEGGSFLRNITLHWSAPLATIRMGCMMSECNNVCNKTINDICLRVNDTMNIRVTNQDGVVYLTYPYNIRQGNVKNYVTPVRGNLTYNGNSCQRGSYVYVYRNTLDGTNNLVFQHNSSVTGVVIRMNITDRIGELNSTISDDPGEFNISFPVHQGNWQLTQDECDGGVLNFKEGVYACIQPSIPEGVDWLWLNGDGTTIVLDKTKELCLSYP